jgi:hypothetical protein
MSITQAQLQRAIDQAHVRESQGYFAKAHAGDQKAASLFVRLVAFDLNPTGSTTDYGWLSKTPGESQVDGFAEDAICFGADPADLQNVVDMVNGAGAPNASIGGSVKERRPTNLWVKPHALTAEEMDYLKAGSAPQPVVPSYESLGGDAFFRSNIGVPLQADMASVGQTLNDGSSVWFSRTAYDCIAARYADPKADLTPICVKHRNEWRAILGLPPV